MRHGHAYANLQRLLTLACAAMLACLAAAAAALLTADPDLTGRRIWRGYYTLLVEASEDNAATARELGRLPGIDAVVSRHTAEVSFNTFGGFKSTTVSGLRGRLDAEDPRLDPYLASVDSLFSTHSRGSDWEVMYLRSDLAGLPAAWALSAALAGRRWRMVDIDSLQTGLRAVLFLAFAFVLWMRGGSRRSALAICAGLVPWLAAVVVEGWTTLLFFFLAAPAGADLLEAFREYLSRRLSGLPGPTRPPRGWAGPRVAWGMVSAGLGATAAVLLARGAAAVLPAALALMSGVALLPLIYALEVQGSLRRFHPVFRAVPILRGVVRRSPWLSPRRVWDLTLVAVVLVSLGAVGGEGVRGRLPHYAPAPIGGVREPVSWAGLEKLAAASSGSLLPSLADYLSHRAFQEALSFGRPYGLPHAGERVRISQYLTGRRGPEILRTERVVKRFQESWIEETLARAPEGSVERLLLDQGFAALVLPGREAAETDSRSGRRSAVAVHLAALAVGLFLAVYLLGRDFRLTPPALCATTSLTLRRHQHSS